MTITTSYKSRMLVLAGAAFAVAMGVGFVGSRIVRLSPPGENFWLIYPALLAAFALAMAATYPWWRRLDEVQKSGQLISWWWGGQIGAVMVLMALVAATGTRSDLSRGGLAVFLGEAVAFGIAWVIWRWRSRGPAE